jgi:hypothetical protein
MDCICLRAWQCLLAKCDSNNRSSWLFHFSMTLSTIAWNCYFPRLTAKSQAIKEVVIVLIVLTRESIWEKNSRFTLLAFNLWICHSDLSETYAAPASELNYIVSFQLQQILSGSCCVSLMARTGAFHLEGRHVLHVNNHKAERLLPGRNCNSVIPSPSLVYLLLLLVNT